MIKFYVLRGDTYEDLKSGYMGEHGRDFSASISGYICGKNYGNDKILVNELNGKKVNAVFSLREIFNEIKRGYRQLVLFEKKGKGLRIA